MSEGKLQRLRLGDAVAGFHGFRQVLPAFATSGPVEPEGADETSAYDQGFQDAAIEAEARFAEERDALRRLVASAQAIAPEASEELAALIAEAVSRMVCHVAGAADVDRDWLRAEAKRAAELVNECDRARTMWLHPADVALLAGSDFGLELCEDPDAARGSIRIDCSRGWIEAGRPYQLEALQAELGNEWSTR